MNNPPNDRSQDRDDFKDFLRYPTLVSSIGIAPGEPGAAVGSFGRTVSNALRETLGWTPNRDNPQAFTAALTQAFTPIEVEEGYTRWKWTPRTYTVQADMGAVTGAQASIYRRAQVARDEAVPLLEGLHPLLSDADLEDCDAARAIVRSDLEELVTEMGLVGGPRVQRLDGLFIALLGSGIPASPDEVGGALGRLRDRFGLSRLQVNTLDEEGNLTNFLILVDYVLDLERSWRAQRDFFDREGNEVFLGTQLVLIDRALAVLAETVRQTSATLRSVFVGDAEQGSIRLPLGPDEPPLTVTELLSWIQHFSTEEAPRLIREAGKDGVVSFIPTLQDLHDLARRALDLSRGEDFPEAPVRGFHTVRVQTALEELTLHLQDALDLAGQVSRQADPALDFIDPPVVDQGAIGVRLNLEGTGFRAPAQVFLALPSGDPNHPIRQLEAHRVNVVSPSLIRATFDLDDAPDGNWDAFVINGDGSRIFRDRIFLVERRGPYGRGRWYEPGGPPPAAGSGSGGPAPASPGPGVYPAQGPASAAPAASALHVAEIDRRSGKPEETLWVTVTGGGFHPNIDRTGVSFGPGISVQAVEVKSPGRMEVKIHVAKSAPPGPRPIEVTNPDGRVSDPADLFEVIS